MTNTQTNGTPSKSYSVLHLFCGLGGGALGFSAASARLGPEEARFETLGAVDFDSDACKAYEALTGDKATCADIAKMTPQELLSACKGRCPDVVFSSPPCKGHSGLLSNDKASSPKYQAMNKLPLMAIELVLAAFSTRPRFILIENVPRMASRGKDMLLHVRALLSREGYVFHEGAHDCGELGGLGQHRTRYLLLARHAPSIPNFVYQPDKQRVRTIGEVLKALPMPQDKKAGPLHQLPKSKWITLVRLALIPAGGDWRALGLKSDKKRFNNVYRIVKWNKPSVAVTAGGHPSSGGVCTADPRVSSIKTRFSNLYRVERWDKPAHTVTGATRPSGGAPSVADPRLERPSCPNLFGVMRWEDPAKTVTGSSSCSGSNGASAVADPRLGCTPWAGSYGVQRFDKPSRAITASSDVHAGTSALADPRAAANVS